MDVMSLGTMGLLRDYHREDCPVQLLNVKDSEVIMDKDAKIHGKDGRSIAIEFDGDKVNIMDNKDLDKAIKINQIYKAAGINSKLNVS